MIIVQLNGGLGNQLFQYAAARSLGVRLATELKFDLSRLHELGERPYRLNQFNLPQSFATPAEVRRFFPGHLINTFRRWGGRPRCQVIVEKGTDYGCFRDYLKAAGADTYLIGFWQSEQYFSEIAHVIKDDMQFVTEATGRNRELAEEMRSCESICIHFRRTDYVARGCLICPNDYYQKALQRITNLVVNPHLYVFSDDPDWCHENVRFNLPMSLISHNSADQDYEDLRLMSNCRHFIIANSSFSWWGAWLGTYKHKIVLAPYKWSSTSPCLDVVPNSWQRVGWD